MNPLVSSQQAHFFSQNGFIEFEALLSDAECDALEAQIEKVVKGRGDKNYANGRDLWRSSEPLKILLLSRRMTAIAFALTNKSALRLGCDQWIPAAMEWEESAKIQDLLSLQGLACVILIRTNLPLEGETLRSTFRLEPGLIPLPRQRGSALIVTPNLLLNFPKMALYSPTDLYLIAYTFPNAVYVHNKKDPCNGALKQLGYNYGDLLKNQNHPLI